MIAEVTIDNFRAFVNFKQPLGRTRLLLGDNGTGKTSFFYLLQLLGQTIHGTDVADLFPPWELCAWDQRRVQSFSFKLVEDEDVFRYSLEIEHLAEEDKRHIRRELLEWNGKPFYRFEDGEAHLFQQTQDGGVTEGAHFPFDSSRSLLSSIPERADNRPLMTFRNSVAHWWFVRINPFAIDPFSKKEEQSLNVDASNFCSWYRHLATSVSPQTLVELQHSLAQAMPGFTQLQLKGTGQDDPRVLRACFDNGHKAAMFQLSEGQRCLIVLYTLAHVAGEMKLDLFIDEPDNFINLREIAPWLGFLETRLEEAPQRQAVLISHHPEVINRMAHGQEIWFHRSGNGPIVTGAYPEHAGLTPAEVMARGWADE